MRIQVITLFPDEFRPLVNLGVTGRALTAGKVRLELLNPRDFARDRHRTVDDRPYGGGPGMVLRVDVVAAAFDAVYGGRPEHRTVALTRVAEFRGVNGRFRRGSRTTTSRRRTGSGPWPS